MAAKYQLRFFFEYHGGGCLWSNNHTSYEHFGFGPLDADLYNLDGKIIAAAKIKLAPTIKQAVLDLDKLYAQSIDWNNPGGPSLWNHAQWESFHELARALHCKISLALGGDYEVMYMQP